VCPARYLILAAIATLVLFSACDRLSTDARSVRSVPAVTAVSPRLVSDQAVYPLTLYGKGFNPGMQIRIAGAGRTETAAVDVVDGSHATVRVRLDGFVRPDRSLTRVRIAAADTDDRGAGIRVVNDSTFPVLIDLELDPAGERFFIASVSTDDVWIVSRDGSAPRRLPVGDGPRALARYRDERGRWWLVVLLQFAAELRLVPFDDVEQAPIRIAVPPDSQDVVVDSDRRRAYVTSRFTDAVHVVDLAERREVGVIAVGVNPRPVALGRRGTLLVVGNLGSSDQSLIDLETGREIRVEPAPGTPIIGGRTERYATDVMGGKAPRDLIFSDRLGVAFLASIGPNVGPNAHRMEVSMNGGIGVVDAAGHFLRHVSMLRGVPAGLALDDTRGLLYVADVATGRVVVFDATRLATVSDCTAVDDQTAREALLGAVEIAPPEGQALIRPVEDFGHDRRSGVALHSGPQAVRLFADGARLAVLNRFTGIVTEIDTADAGAGTLRIVANHAGPPMQAQQRRRLGEIVFFTDLANSRMSCDACHPEGHDGGILYEKTHPLHIYRVPTLRGVRETAPYFTPRLLPSLRETARSVLGRNRFHNPNPSAAEIDVLALYQETITPLPNPYLAAHLGFPSEIALPDGTTGSPLAGMGLFEGKAGCIGCHPPPQFTTDQDPSTRARLHDVGTPITLPLRLEQQDTEPYLLPPPSLVGVWDAFPLLHSGAGGLEVSTSGSIEARHSFALRHVLDMRGPRAHGDVTGLTALEKNDLLAYLLTL
jgi:DNA-binding beta-propeller fold protein YncE